MSIAKAKPDKIVPIRALRQCVCAQVMLSEGAQGLSNTDGRRGGGLCINNNSGAWWGGHGRRGGDGGGGCGEGMGACGDCGTSISSSAAGY